jgi:acetyl esterase/lipase
MDLHRPAMDGAVPVIVFVHGGAFVSGTRHVGFFVDTLLPALVARGFAVAAIEYRLAPQYPWPAQIEDVKCAVRFLRGTGPELGLDTTRIGAWGESAGGHLAAMLATPSGFEAGPYLDRSSRVQAVLDVNGPAALDASDWPASSVEWLHEVFGSDPERLRAASPVTYVAQDAPPFLLVHGDRDEIVPYTQSLALARRLRLVGTNVTMLSVEGAAHDLRPGHAMRPPHPEIVSIAVDFFAAQLGVSARPQGSG